MEEFFVLVTLPGTEERFTRTCQGTVLVGRGDDCDIHLPHPLVSRRHVELSPVADGGILVRDLDSSNGTVVGEMPLRDAATTVPGEAAVQVGPYVLHLSAAITTSDDTLLERSAHAGRVALDRDRRAATIDGELTVERLSPQEFLLLDILAARAPHTLPNRQLGDSVWGEGQWDTYMLHNLIRRVRRKFEQHGATADELVVTVPGAGYRLA